MSESNWILVATNRTGKSYVAQTTLDDSSLLYRVLCKWLIRGSASNILNIFWEYIDQYDNELEEALLDQLNTQAESKTDDPQITNVRTKDYSIDITVNSKISNENFKTCKLDCVLFVYFHSLKKKLRIDEQSIEVTMVKSDSKIERITVSGSEKTPAHVLKGNRRVSKRSSRDTPGAKGI